MPPIEIVKQIGRERVKKKGGFSFITQKCCLAEELEYPRSLNQRSQRFGLIHLEEGLWCEAKQAVHSIPARTWPETKGLPTV